MWAQVSFVLSQCVTCSRTGVKEASDRRVLLEPLGRPVRDVVFSFLNCCMQLRHQSVRCIIMATGWVFCDFQPFLCRVDNSNFGTIESV